MAHRALLDPSPLRYGATPFDQIKHDDFLPALDEAIKEAKQKILMIKRSTDPANFHNTMAALEQASEKVEYVASVFFNLLSAHGDDPLQKLAQEFSPRLSEFASDIALDAELFAKVKAVYEMQNRELLSREESRLLEKTYKEFVRGGALLSARDQAKLREIDQELARLSPLFSENLLRSANAFTLIVRAPSELKGLPASAVESAKLTAREKSLEDCWVFTLDQPSYVPFMTYAEDRDLRRQLWQAYNARAFGGEFDNQQIVLQTARLRHQRARLLGFENHAAYVLEERMAEKPEKVTGFLRELLAASKPAALAELAEITAFAHERDGISKLEPWDLTFYAERLRETKFNLNQEELRPYFRLENVVQGAFEHARRLYDLSFTEQKDVPVYHPDVKCYLVQRATSQEFVGLFYADFFPRATKRNGAWMTNFIDQGLHHGTKVRPHVSIVCNFTKPTADKPSLLTFDEVQTLFHEFGHSLHSLLSQVTYRSLSGTQVLWDFVELPSQIMENWVLERESLNLFAKHYVTEELLPESLAVKLKESARFLAGYSTVRQVNLSLLDMAWHSREPENLRAVDEFEREVTRDSTLIEPSRGSNVSCGFSHIFSGGYSAGYYSYKWAEVLDADAFELFSEQGIFNREVAARFEMSILSRGGTEHPSVLYRHFRGRDPDPNALLRRDGLISPATSPS